MQPKYLVVAHLFGPHGLKGEIDAQSLTDFPERFVEGLELYPSPPIPGISALTIERFEQRPKGLLFKFAEANTREEAEVLNGHDLLVPAEEAVELNEDEFWVHDIVGMEVHTTSGELLGHITEVLRTGSNDVYVVQNGKEHLIPATREVVKDISLKDRKITIEPIPGLLE